VASLSVAAGTWRLWRTRKRTAPQPAAAHARARRLLASVPLEVLALGLVAGVLAQPWLDVRAFAVSEHDATHIWVPKAVRALEEAPPHLGAGSPADPAREVAHAHPEYPRGLGILTAAVSAPLGRLDPRLPRAVPLALFLLTLLCVLDALSARGNAAGGFAAMIVLASIPLVLRSAASGLADVPLSAFVLLGCAGLALGRSGASVGATLAGGAGAMTIKDEGVVFLGALVLVLAVRLARQRRLAAAGAAVAAAAVLAAPWIALRSQPDAGVPHLQSSILENAGVLLMRCDLMFREIAHLVLGSPDPSPGGYAHADVVPGGDLVLLAALACFLALVIGRGGRFPVLPLGLLLLADFVAIVLSHVQVEWQLVTALNRLLLQCLPALLVAAVDKVTAAPEGASA
jgi:hypothetical protein